MGISRVKGLGGRKGQLTPIDDTGGGEYILAETGAEGKLRSTIPIFVSVLTIVRLLLEILQR